MDRVSFDVSLRNFDDLVTAFARITVRTRQRNIIRFSRDLLLSDYLSSRERLQ